MNVRELIYELQKIEDKTLEIGHRDCDGDYVSIDEIEIIKERLLFTNINEFVKLG